MEIFLYALAALAIASAVVLWHVYDARIASWVKGGPITPTPRNLSGLVDKMHAAKNEALSHAAVLEKEIASVRTDLSAATSKLVPAATSELNQ